MDKVKVNSQIDKEMDDELKEKAAKKKWSKAQVIRELLKLAFRRSLDKEL